MIIVPLIQDYEPRVTRKQADPRAKCAAKSCSVGTSVLSVLGLRRWTKVIAAFLCWIVIGQQVIAQAITEDIEPFESLPPVLTHSPRDTLQSLENLRDALIGIYLEYQVGKSAQQWEQLVLIGDALISLLDLTEENVAERRDASIRTALALIDIIGEVGTEEAEALPDDETVYLEDRTTFLVPNTPLIIQRVNAGNREGEFLFSASSSQIAPRYLREIAMQSPHRVAELWSTRFLQLSGPFIPLFVENALPPASRKIFWGTPIWKIGFTFFFLMISLALLYGLRFLLNRRVASGQMPESTRKFVFAGAVLVILLALNNFFNNQLFLTGSFALTETFFATITIYAAAALTFWRFMSLLSDRVAEKKTSIVRQYDESMMRLLNHIIALVGATWILAYGAQTLGFPLLSIIAGLGVGGLAVALAIRPTLENLISGFVIYMEKAVKVGDYCSFLDKEGTIESIGVRSTHVRGLDRTTIAIPNSKFVNMELVNWARCDEMMIRTTLGLRLETDTDQLRYVLAEIRSMMYAHPRITSDTARVRFIGYGDSSLNIEIRVYAQTREWNAFYAIQEDVLFRTKEIVEASGTGFAFPSQTVYMSQDGGLDAAKSKHAVEQVEQWRRRRDLPFPDFSTAERDRLEGTLRYPPRGSPEFDGPDDEKSSVEEPLSVEEPEAEDTSNGEDSAPNDEENSPLPQTRDDKPS